MNTKKIIADDIEDLRVSSLPSRPTAPTSFGGRGYTASQMKAAFDRLPLFIIERFNSLIDDVGTEGDGSLAADIPTGISEGHTLAALFADVLSGEMAKYLSLGEKSVREYADGNDEKIGEILSDLEICFRHITDTVVDCGAPSGRDAVTGGVAV